MIDLRPRKLDAYIVRKFISTFFIALILIIGIVIIFDISEKIDDFVSKEAPLKAIIFDYYLNFVPYFMNMFSPLFVFITVIFFTSKMAADSEIIAILSCGISFHRMMVPYIFSASLIALLSLCLNLFVIPESNKTRLDFENKYVKTRFMSVGRNVHYQISPGEFVYAESFSSWNKTAYRFTLERIEDNKLISKISAESAVYDTTSGKWRLKKYFIRDYNEDLTDQIRSGEQLDTTLALSVKDFYLTEEQIRRRIAEIGAEITKRFQGESVYLVCILKGSIFVTTELAKHIALPMIIDFMTVSSYGAELSGIYENCRQEYL